ncbi:cache domain-containing sensor histidine kinase [Caldalkalibacillus salinus]|uniref:cache domain-containing sensor histidine kinase n=1 Tax=Caldalkalibacillus salinus TaxID=2803787 RepID=UPI0019249658|nr:sensor histidine kinase [Caldalkalibacillus salinus]
MFKFVSIRNKLIILLLVITIVPFGSAIIVTYMYTKESLTEQSIQENMNLLYQGKENIETYLKDLNHFNLSLYHNHDFMNYLKIKHKVSDYVSIGAVHRELLSLLYSDDHINKASMWMVRNGELFSVSKRSTLVYEEQVDRVTMTKYLRAKEAPSDMYTEPLEDDESFVIYRAFRDTPLEEVLAYITLEVEIKKINELSQRLYHEGEEEFYILTPGGHFIYHSEETDKDLATSSWITTLLQTDNMSGHMTWEDDTFRGVIAYDTVTDYAGQWLLVKRIPYHTLYQSAYGVALINILFGVVGLALVILATFLVSFRITNPIRVLVQNIRQVEQGTMQVDFHSLGNDEIGILGHRFKRMVEKIHDLINREYKLEIENKTNQLKVLQSQVNPHFLYNTLQSIGTRALKNQVPEIYKSLTDLSHLMRYSMNTEEHIVPLSKEVEVAKAYLLLQKQRFGDDLSYVIDADEDMLDVQVPKMILQPIIENYFKHGFDTRVEPAKIEIHCRQTGDSILISIEDNGTGVSEERLQMIRQDLKGASHSGHRHTGIGLKNVYTRLQLYYTHKASLILENTDVGGFRVTMTFPLKLEDGTYESHHH